MEYFIFCLFFSSLSKLNKDLCTKVFLLFLLPSFVSETSDREVKRRQEAAFLGGTFRNFNTVLRFFQIFSCLPPFFYIIKTYSMRRGGNKYLWWWSYGALDPPIAAAHPSEMSLLGNFSHRNICYHSMIFAQTCCLNLTHVNINLIRQHLLN